MQDSNRERETGNRELETHEMTDPSFYSRIGKLSSVIFVLPSCMAVGWILGYFVVDRFLPTYPWGTVLFVLLGAGAGFYEIFQILSADQRRKDVSS
jgi:F0F1-type ATP synthase assembly protein I